MSSLRAALLLAVLVAPTAAPAATFSEISDKSVAALTLADAMISRRPLMVQDEAQAEATQSYFDYDALLTLGAFALAAGGLAAFARRPRNAAPAQKVWLSTDFAHPRDAA